MVVNMMYNILGYNWVMASHFCEHGFVDMVTQ